MELQQTILLVTTKRDQHDFLKTIFLGIKSIKWIWEDFLYVMNPSEVHKSIATEAKEINMPEALQVAFHYPRKLSTVNNYQLLLQSSHADSNCNSAWLTWSTQGFSKGKKLFMDFILEVLSAHVACVIQ